MNDYPCSPSPKELTYRIACDMPSGLCGESESVRSWLGYIMSVLLPQEWSLQQLATVQEVVTH